MEGYPLAFDNLGQHTFAFGNLGGRSLDLDNLGSQTLMDLHADANLSTDFYKGAPADAWR